MARIDNELVHRERESLQQLLHGREGIFCGVPAVHVIAHLHGRWFGLATMRVWRRVKPERPRRADAHRVLC